MQGQKIDILAFKLNEFENSCLPFLTTIKDTVEDLQKFVGGTFQICRLTDDLDLVCNDDGKLLNMPPNYVWINPKTNDVLDIIVGDFFVCRHIDDELDDIKVGDIEVVLSYLKPILSVKYDVITLLPSFLCPLYKPKKEVVENLYSKGDIIALIERIDDPYSSKPIGSTAEVEYVDDALNIHVKWHNSKGNISLIYGKDYFINLAGKSPNL